MELDIRFGDPIADSEGEVLVVPMFDGGSWGPGGDWLAERMPGLEDYLETSGFEAAAATTKIITEPSRDLAGLLAHRIGGRQSDPRYGF